MAYLDQGNADAGRSAMAKASWRLLPLIGIAYLLSYVDRVNISFAAPTMNADLRFSATVYGIGGGLFFLSYALLGIPSSLLLVRIGARRWIAGTMIVWGLLAAAMMFVRSPASFYCIRFLLGAAEAGFFPGLLYYLSQWFPRPYRARALSRFYVALPLSSAVMGVLSAGLLDLEGVHGLHGWQWLFVVQGLPASLIGVCILLFLPKAPAEASWLSGLERDWMKVELRGDGARVDPPASRRLFAGLRKSRCIRLAAIGFLTVGSNATFALSMPLLLSGFTGMPIGSVGSLVSVGGLAGAAAMLLVGWHSDRRGDRFTYLIWGLIVSGLYYLVGSHISYAPLGIAAFLLYAAASNTAILATWAIVSDTLGPGDLAIGAAVVNTTSQIGAFIGPILWGMSLDRSGHVDTGLNCLGAISLLTALAAYMLSRRGADPRLAKQRRA